ncbi:MAG: helix-turn-helix transcriptional regulator [Steroidobacter sp.]
MNASQSASEAPLRLLRLEQVCEVTGLRRSMIYQLEAELRFPKRVKLAARAVGWVEHEVQAWMLARIDARQAQPTTHQSSLWGTNLEQLSID